MKKGMFISNNKEIYLGTITLPNFKPIQKADMEKYIAINNVKDCFKCIVCEDVYIGSLVPKTCPTCLKNNSFKKISNEELKKFLEKYFVNRHSPGLFYKRTELFSN